MWNKIKGFLVDDTVFYGLLMVLIGLSSFGLGRWSIDPPGLHNQPASIILNNQPESGRLNLQHIEGGGELGAADAAPTATSVTTGQFVASKNGSKYHFPWCPGAKQMKEENKVWFSSREEAETAGYSPAANCKGL